MAKVLSVILRLDGHHFAAPTQLLPSGGDPDECDDALQSFTEAMKVAGGTNQGQAVKLPAGSFSWKSYRQATKAVLAGLANSLRNCLPGSWNLSKCIPPNLLSPASLGCDRVAMVEMEEMMFQDCGKKNLFFNYDFRSFKGTPQFYLDESFHRLIFSADEGTEASLISGKNMGCTGFLFSFIREISCFLCGRRI